MLIDGCGELMKNQVIFMFSGQGSQYFHMGKELYEHEGIFNQNMKELDSIFQNSTGNSLIEYLYDEDKLKSDDFSDLCYTQPAIFMIEVALAHFLVKKGIRPNAVIGSSLGEYAAGAIANVFRPKDILNILVEQVHLLEKYSQSGGMIAILASPRLYEEVPVLHHHCYLVSINNENHFVISSNQDGINLVEKYLQIKEIAFLKLPVTVPFHTKYIDLASEEVQNSMTQITYQSPTITFYSSVTGEKKSTMNAKYLWEVLRKPIHFNTALFEMVQPGAILIDIGPSGTLANIARAQFKQRNDLSIFSTLSPYTDDLKALEKIYENVLV